MSGGEATATVEFGQLLRRCRRTLGLSQEELGVRADVCVRTISDLERGQRTRPYRHTVGTLAEALGLRGRCWMNLCACPALSPRDLEPWTPCSLPRARAAR